MANPDGSPTMDDLQASLDYLEATFSADALAVAPAFVRDALAAAVVPLYRGAAQSLTDQRVSEFEARFAAQPPQPAVASAGRAVVTSRG